MMFIFMSDFDSFTNDVMTEDDRMATIERMKHRFVVYIGHWRVEDTRMLVS